MEKQRGGLRLDSKNGWAMGGDSGPAIIPGDMDSLLLEVIRYETGSMEMPPRGKLPADTIAAFEKWIQSGAHDPREVGNPPGSSDENKTKQVDKSFWSFQPLSSPTVSSANETTQWASSSLDHFIFRQLQDEQLSPAPRASRETLIRRLHYDLIGLPPTPEAIKKFISDPDPNAWETLIDDLLSRPEFGERWGRHWLDVVRFAESSGGGRTLLFPDAWRYRDYVIESFNEGTPYDRFIVEQIAGDLLSSESNLERQRNLIATGFLLLGPTNYELQDKDVLEMDVVDEQLDTIGKSMMGMTIGCARCHDHKFDPIPTADYYALAGILKSTNSLIHSNVSTWNTVKLPLEKEKERLFEVQQKRIEELREDLKKAKDQLNELKGTGKPKKQIPIDTIKAVVLDDSDAKIKGDWTQSEFVAGFVGTQYIHDDNKKPGEKSVTYTDQERSSGEYRIYASYTTGPNRSSKVPVTIKHAEGETTVTVNQRKPPPVHGVFYELGTFTFDDNNPAIITIANQRGQDGVVIADSIILAAAEQSIDETFPIFNTTAKPKDNKDIKALQGEIENLEAVIKKEEKESIKRPVAMAVTEIDSPCDIAVAIRGVTAQKGEIIPRDVLSAAKWEAFPKLDEKQSGRLELAHWIANAKHPLTARVMANRIWYWMMGRGIVSSLDNFGSTGTPPSHPELLDHLAHEFIDKNWSIKSLIKTIALSSTYQQSSDSIQNQKVDPDNRLFSRANRKRLRAEDLRDTLLVLGKSLDQKRGGPSIKPGTTIEYDYQFDSQQRSVYLPIFRNTLPEVFEFFDFADPNIQQGRRNESTVASQALWLMNHPMVLEQSQKAAQHLVASDLNSTEKLELAFLQTVGRLPSTIETEIMLGLAKPSPTTDDDNEEAETAVNHWTMIYQTLCQSVDFLYLN